MFINNLAIAIFTLVSFASFNGGGKSEIAFGIDYMVNYFKDLDERNRYWINVFEIMPKKLQEQIMFASCSVSTGIMIWIQAGLNKKEIKIRSEIIDNFEKEWKKNVK